jgi:hypothetical protein
MKKRATTKTPDTRTLSEKRRDAALKSAARRRMTSKGPKHGSATCLMEDRKRIVEIADERRITITDAVRLCVEAYDQLHAKSIT